MLKNSFPTLYAWLRTTDICSKNIIDNALKAMLDSFNLQFINIMDTLTEKQRNFLCAVSDGPSTRLFDRPFDRLRDLSKGVEPVETPT